MKGGQTGVSILPLPILGADANDCWGWNGSISEGVAQKQFNGERMPARRWMWLVVFGYIPAGFVVTTSCGSKICTNPFHLRCCLQADANRNGIGTTLLPGDVVDIRKARKGHGPLTANLLAERFGVSPQTIRDIWRGKSWRKGKNNNGPNRNTGTEQDAAAAA